MFFSALMVREPSPGRKEGACNPTSGKGDSVQQYGSCYDPANGKEPAMEITPMTDHTGAEVRGIDLARPATPETRQALNAAFVAHSVLVIREQSLEPQQLLEAVALFGSVFQQHNTRFAIPECPQIHYLSNEDRFPDGTRYIPGEGWHTDHSNDVRPPKATVLHAVTLPGRGGDTQFANMAAAYAMLPAALQERIADLMAIHVYQSSHSARKLMTLSDANKERVPNAVLHPMVRTHPENGAKSIYINPIRIEGILGMDHKEALPLLVALLEHATAERFQYRHGWKPGDLVIWDNRCLLHKANGDYDMAQKRYLYRVMLQGDVPR
jgi:taurine dioxygenase